MPGCPVSSVAHQPRPPSPSRPAAPCSCARHPQATSCSSRHPRSCSRPRAASRSWRSWCGRTGRRRTRKPASVGARCPSACCTWPSRASCWTTWRWRSWCVARAAPAQQPPVQPRGTRSSLAAHATRIIANVLAVCSCARPAAAGLQAEHGGLQGCALCKWLAHRALACLRLRCAAACPRLRPPCTQIPHIFMLVCTITSLLLPRPKRTGPGGESKINDGTPRGAVEDKKKE